MSDEIDLNQSHLCATEDAFEKFQSVSMYEEDEYIALSDIVSPPPGAPDLAAELIDIPYENEVVLDSNLEEQVPEVNSTIEIGAEEEQSSLTSCPAVETGEITEEVPVETPKESRPIKRGRKKKTQNNELLITSLDKPDEHNGLLEANIQSSEALASPPTTQRKRGRRPKNAMQTPTNNTTDPHIDSETPEAPKRPSRTRIPNRMISQTYDTLNANTPPKRTPGKRGRPKKSNLEPQITKDINLLEPVNDKEDTSIGDETYSTPLEKPIVKRGRKKKVVVEEVFNSQHLEENIELREHNQNCDMLVDQDVNNKPITSPTKKSPGKRGRPKKIHTIEKAKTDTFSAEQSSSELTKDDDDDADDVCLSQLKSTLEISYTDSKISNLLEDTKTNGIHSIDRPVDVCDQIPQEELLPEVTKEVLPVVSEDTSLSISEVVSLEEDKKDTSAKINSEAPVLTDFEYNLDNIADDNKADKIITENQDQFQGNDGIENKESLLIEDTSKRPIRRKTKQQLHYDEESDEDPFANIELSDEDDMRGRKGRYYSDDEYIPGVENKKKRGNKHVEVSASDTSDSDIDNNDEEIMQLKRKKFRKLDGSPCKKRGRKSKEELAMLAQEKPPEVSTIKPDEKNIVDDDVEICLETSIIKASEDSKKSWGASNEFESFIAKKIQGTDIKIKKASTPVQPLEIPVIDANTVNKTIEISTQTAEIQTTSVEVQTAAPYDIPMKDNVSLTAEQSESACEFLNNIVKTTAELGELMTQKSQDFIKKKINTSHVTDTFKMDYCVRKSFLLFKLAQHNLRQMEDDLAQQYDDFLSTHNLSHHREKPKEIKAETKAKDSDSDCEIIEAPVPSKPAPSKKAVPFNPKTVFLNKELSIKIAKKPSDDKKLNIKGRHTVWINDSVMVKKVKPTQSFLAQDSRNKKPPDYVTIEMVNSFFNQYYREKALVTCAPFVSSEWVTQDRIFVCNYFFAKTDFPSSTGMASESGHCDATESNTPEMNDSFCHSPVENSKKSSPKTLFSLCSNFLQNYLQNVEGVTRNKIDTSLENAANCNNNLSNPKALYTLCVDSINRMSFNNQKCHEVVKFTTPSPLKTLCHKMIVEFLFTNSESINSRPESPLSAYDHETSLESRPDSPIWKYSSQFLEDDLTNLNLEPWMNFRPDNVKSLFSICFDIIKAHLNLRDEQSYPIGNYVIIDKSSPQHKPHRNRKQKSISLKHLAYRSVVNLIYQKENFLIEDNNLHPGKVKKVKTLADICFEIVSKAFTDSDDLTQKEGLTINAVNTLTEEAYHNIEQSESSENADDYYDDSNFYDGEIDSGMNNSEEASHMEDNWLSQVKMKISSCYDPSSSTIQENAEEEQVGNSFINDSIVAQIKLEPLDEVPETVDTSLVKSEPMSHLDEMTIIPESIITKSEFLDTPVTAPQPIQRQNSSSFDVDQFESFVSTNKMIHNMDNYEDDDEIFSQSALRVRRQHEPDSDTENDMNMSLLVPQTFEPMPVIEKEKAKNSLMESSSDESSSSNTKKAPAKKKPDKRGRGRPKKGESKPPNNKEVPKEKPIVPNEIAILTRRMRDKIRQQEKKAALSDSDHDDTDNLLLKKGKEKSKDSTDKLKSKASNRLDIPDKEKVTDNTKLIDSKHKTDPTGKENVIDKTKTKDSEHADNEIQCSNVDSTEKVSPNLADEFRNESPSTKDFTGFTAVDQNEISSYQKYVKYVYDQILPKDSDENKDDFQENTQNPVINPEEPVELLECEPSMPFFMNESSKPKRGRPKKEEKKESTRQNKSEKVDDKCGKEKKTDNVQDEKRDEVNNSISASTEDAPQYVERHGWKCYPLDGNDTKLYQDAQILLEKLPETFVETYFRYQDISGKTEEDDEVDRLTNLQTLNRPSGKDGVSEGKSKGKPKCKIQPQVRNAVFSILGLDESAPGVNAPDDSRPASPANSEHEFTPSEDEGGKVDDEEPPPVTKPTSDNNLAKSSLMNDNDSDEETRIKQEPREPNAEPSESEPKPAKKYKPGPKSKRKEIVPAAPVMLTADKMMNKELNLLHAPVTLDDEDVKPKISGTKGPVTRNKQKNSNKTPPKERVKADDDSSSEEEKQWFTIKEKLLKRMVKNKDTTREDDAKRAKLVSEFIERRGDGTESYIKKRGRGVRGRRSKKKLLERQKQLKVLTRELFGDPSNDASLQRKKQTGAYFKGRRNIRKVLDKKSLAKSTVVANMEEFERKRRLNIKQNKLREVLGCEEGVNVLVINDEVCLEYDFEQNRPVVTIHPFFTKVMKAHQYEGVKFMWDACFESLETLAAGDPGGGCILAHCMGLGKTLQVLALLHTVLTHPGVGMQRILVCCPLSTVLNWVDEIHKWIGPVTNQIKVFELSKLKKTYERAYQLEDWYNGGGIFIIGYELFRSLTTLDPFLDDVRPTIVNKIRTALLDPGPDIIICDEGHLLKNDCSVLAVAMSRVATRRRIVLTGTPMQNNLREYYCMVNFVKPNLLGTYAEYSNRFENPIMNGQHRDSREEDIRLMKARTHILHKVLEGCLQRQEASVLYPYLPKKHEYTVFISLTKCQWDLYKHYLKNYSNTQNNKSILKDFHILQKIWSHPQVLHNFQMRVCDQAKERAKVKVEKLEDDLAREDLTEAVDVKPSDTEVWWLQYLEGGAMLDALASSNKFVTVFRILDEARALGDKVLIFSTSLFTMDTLEFFLRKINKWSLGQEYYRLDGSVPAEVRQKWCREFNAENNHKTKLFLISTRAGSLGLNMTAANRVIILDTSWNPAHDIQSIFRVYRFGQKKDCYIYRLVALGTMEQKIYERSVTKQAVACRVVDEQQIDRHYNMAELTELYKYDETGVGVAGGVAVGVEDVVLLRVARDAALHAVHEHDSLLRGSAEPGLPEHERNAAWMQFQQEHAHKQMQEDALQQALLEQKLKQEKDLAQGIQPAPIPVKRPNRKYAKIKIPIQEPVEESILPEPLPAPPPPPKQRGRKPKNANVVSCRIPIQPEIDPDKEMEMVKKIADILVKFNFHNHKPPSEISALVSRVRQIVTSGRLEQLDSSDQLTMSLASVFLPNDEPPMPALTDIQSEPGPSPKEEPKVYKPRGRKKGSGLKRYVLEEVPSTSAEPPPEPDPEGSRTRRRAAIAAERNFDTIGDSVIDIGDDDWQNDAADDWQNDAANDWQTDPDTRQLDQDPPQETEKQPPVEPKNDKFSIRIRKTYLKKAPEQEPVVKEKEVVQDSILLSDDEDDLPIKKKPGPARKTLRGRKTKDEEAKEKEKDTPQPAASSDVPVVPLHPSLLSNKNFIKIVAHTYLSGNPMLDEDAATLAAQYSTFKALKEYESTGKHIDSGPIYDIAVKVLGRDVLLKLHGGNNKVVASDIISSHPIKSKETAISKEVAAKVDPPVVKQESEKKLKPVKLKIRIPPLPASLAAAGDAATPAPSGNVVPVGLFKRAEEGPSQTADECILPDDDLHIISDPAPPPPAPPPPANIPKITIGRRNSVRMVLNKVKADSGAPIVLRQVIPRVPANPPPLTPAPAPPITPPTPPVPAPVATEEILSDLTTTINLDSDDDEPPPAPTPAPPPPAPGPTMTVSPGGIVTVMSRAPSAPPPVPVSLVQAAPPIRLRQIPAPHNPVSSVAPVTSAPAPVYLNSMLGPGSMAQTSGSNYILIPSDEVAAPSPAVPVALSRVHLNSQGVPQLTRIHQAAVPTSIQNAVAQATAQQMAPQMLLSAPNILQPQQYQLATPIYHQQTNVLQLQPASMQPQQIQPRQNQLPQQWQPPPQQPPPQAQPAPRAPPPVQKQTAKAPPPAQKQTAKAPPPAQKQAAKAQTAGQANKRMCKPGDILRITEGGKIEVLKRKDIPDDVDTPSSSKTVIIESVRKTPAQAAAKRVAPKAPPTPAKNPQPIRNDTNVRKQSSSSDDDPLSILRDVVHIEADDYITGDVQPSVVTPSKPYSNTKPSEKSSGTITQKTVINKNRIPETSSREAKKTEQNKGKERFLGSVDLTDGDAPVAAASKKPQGRGLAGATTIVGTSKSIILCGSGKAVAKINTPAKAPEKREPLGGNKQATATPSKVEVKKRPAPVDTSATKKKKTDKPMTLKDFNLDDIDDIIELD